MITLQRSFNILLVYICCVNFIYGQANTCQTATMLCSFSEFDGYNGSMPDSNPIDEPLQFCEQTGTSQNLTWISFTAGSVNASLEITFSNCDDTGTEQIQYGVYIDCTFNEFLPSACQGTPIPTIDPVIVNLNDMVPGDDYYLFLDGDLGAFCDYSIIILSGNDDNTLPDPVSLNCISANCPSDGELCSLGTTLTFQPADTDIAADYIWTITPGPPSGPSGITTNPENSASFTFNNAGAYEICVVIDNGCIQTNPVCYELNVFIDEDNDGVCDAEDICINGPEPDTACDDNNDCTINDITDANCECIGMYQDSDNDGTCDAEDQCDGPEPRSACNDNDDCTINDIIDANCECIGIYQDSDNDGTCDAEDQCDGPEPGSACNDNDDCTINDVIDDSCNCIGIFQDADNDGTCDVDDLCPGGDEPGTNCNDNNDCTINDIINPNCFCIGTFLDSDNDGTCDAEDQCNGGLEPGNNCDDGNPCTLFDEIDDSCNCIGIFQDADNDGTCDAEDQCNDGPEPGSNCDDNDDNTLNDQINTDCICQGTIDPDFCPELDLLIGDNCDDGEVCTINDIVDSECNCLGTYQDSDSDGTCDAEDQCNIGPEPGADCDDGDPCTASDKIDDNCNCVGIFQDSDNDGTCDAEDQCNNGPEPGTNCDDNNTNTFNDQIDKNCNCVGNNDPNYCPGLELYIGDVCSDNDNCTVNDTVTSYCECIGLFIDSDDDGICDEEDQCNGPEPGTACDDKDATTINDVITNECVCMGEDPNTAEEESLEYKFYPNPSTTFINIELSGDFIIEIFTIDGILINTYLGKDLLSSNVSSLNSGIYFVKISQDNRSNIKRMVKI